MTSLEQNFRNLRKVSSQNFAMIMWSKFYKNRPKIVAIRDPDRQTDTHTHTHRKANRVILTLCFKFHRYSFAQ